MNILAEKMKEFGVSDEDLNLIESTIQARVDEAATLKAQELLEAERQDFEQKVAELTEAHTAKLNTQAAELMESLEAKYAAKVAELFEATNQEAAAKFTEFATAMDGYAEKLMESLEAKYRDGFEEDARAIVESFAEKFDKYAAYITEQVATKHQTQSELKVALAESLLNTIKEAFVAHNIQLPDAVDFGSEYEQFVTESDAQLKALAEENKALKRQLVEAERVEILDQITEGMTVMQKDTFGTLVESIAFIDKDAYKTRLLTMKEKFLATAAPATVVEAQETTKTELLTENAVKVVDVNRYTFKRSV